MPIRCTNPLTTRPFHYIQLCETVTIASINMEKWKQKRRMNEKWRRRIPANGRPIHFYAIIVIIAISFSANRLYDFCLHHRIGFDQQVCQVCGGTMKTERIEQQRWAVKNVSITRRMAYKWEILNGNRVEIVCDKLWRHCQVFKRE